MTASAVFLAADSARWEELQAAVRDYLAWCYVRDNAEGALNLTAQQRQQALERATRGEQTVRDRLTGTYHWALLPSQPDAAKPLKLIALKSEGSTSSLAERTAARLTESTELVHRRAASLIRLDLDGPLRAVWERDGHIAFGQLWDYYTTYPYLARLRDRSVLADGVHSVLDGELIWQQTGFGLAFAWDGERYSGLVLPGGVGTPPEVTDSLLLVNPERALAQHQQDVEERQRLDGELPETAAGTRSSGGDRGQLRGNTPAAPLAAPSPAPRTVRYYGAKVLDAERYAGHFSKLTTEVIQHLAAVDGVELEVRVEITAHTPAGFDESKIRTVSENATVLKFEQSGFEQS